MTSIRVLKNFIAITRHPSVAAAAREIGLTPAAAGPVSYTHLTLPTKA